MSWQSLMEKEPSIGYWFTNPYRRIRCEHCKELFKEHVHIYNGHSHKLCFSCYKKWAEELWNQAKNIEQTVVEEGI